MIPSSISDKLKVWLLDERCEAKYPYSPNELVSNLEGVLSWKKNPKPREFVMWQPPPLRKWKWNVDGSA